MQEHRTKLDEHGRLVIPIAFRNVLNIKAGDHVVLRIEGDELHISSIKQALKCAQRLVKQYIGIETILTDSLKADRRKESALSQKNEAPRKRAQRLLRTKRFGKE